MSEARAFKTAALTEVNQRILDVAQASASEELEWEFFCECGGLDCHDYVKLSLEEYVAVHDGGQPVLAEGHRLSQVERARRLEADADALRRQAQHQLRRAQKNLRSPGH
jgi:hypothetical protein